MKSAKVRDFLILIESQEEADKIKQDLLEYCRLDTLGMVKIVERLKELCGK